MNSSPLLLLLYLAAWDPPSSSVWAFRRPKRCTEERLGDHFCATDDSGVEYIDVCWWVGERPNRVAKFVRDRSCTYPKSKCHELHEVDEQSKAWCIDGTPRPPFPSIGTLRWNGTKMYNDEAYDNNDKDKRWANEYGHAMIDRAGNYYETNTRVKKWGPKSKPYGPHTMKTSFKYIKPKANGYFNKYYGYFIPALGERHCYKQVVKYTGSLQDVWDLWRDSIYELQGRRNVSENAEEQRWEETTIFEEADSFISWNMTYFRKEGYAIPNTKFQERNDDDGLKWIDRLKFSYDEPVDVMQVKLPTYCK